MDIKNLFNVIFFISLLSGVSGCTSGIAENDEDQLAPNTFCNPINISYRFADREPSRRTAADPVIVLFKDHYFLFSTGSSEYWYSKDLAHWEIIPEGVSQLPQDCTAPAITVVGDTVYFMSSRSDKGYRYASTDPLSGRWELVPETVKTWDPALFVDDDNRLYYYWGCSPGAPLFGTELDKDFQPVGEIKRFVEADSLAHGWERRGDDNELSGPAWVEGPWMTKHKGKYYLQYSAPGTEYTSYADGVYTSENPLGPFKYELYSPFSYKPGGFIRGAGHGATFKDKYGNLWRVVTMVIAVHEGFERRLGIIPAGFDEDGVFYTQTLLGDFPVVVPDRKVDHRNETATGWMLLNYGKKATASSSLPGYEPDRAIDENVKTWWTALSASKEEWLMIDLGHECRINAFQVNFAEHDANVFGRGRELYHQYVIEGSENGDTWEMLVNKSQNREDVPHDYVPLDNPVKTRFVRLSGIKMAGEGPVAVRDLRIFGKGPGKAPERVSGLIVQRDENNLLSARLEWESVPDAMGYVVRYGISPGKLYHDYQVMGTNKLTINSLNRDASYYFTVDVFNENGYTAGINIVKIK